MPIISTFVTLNCGTNFGELGALVFVVPFKALALESFLCKRFLALDLLGRGDGEGLSTECNIPIPQVRIRQCNEHAQNGNTLLYVH